MYHHCCLRLVAVVFVDFYRYILKRLTTPLCQTEVGTVCLVSTPLLAKPCTLPGTGPLSSPMIAAEAGGAARIATTRSAAVPPEKSCGCDERSYRRPTQEGAPKKCETVVLSYPPVILWNARLLHPSCRLLPRNDNENGPVRPQCDGDGQKAKDKRKTIRRCCGAV